jgi:hypothetical protein
VKKIYTYGLFHRERDRLKEDKGVDGKIILTSEIGRDKVFSHYGRKRSKEKK